MTEKDRELTEKLLKEAVENQNKMIGLQLENIIDKLDVIDKKLSWTNGKVGEHERKINHHENELGRHYLTCPNSTDISELKTKVTNLQMMEVGREAVSKFTWKQVTGIGIVAGIVFGALKFILDLIKTI